MEYSTSLSFIRLTSSKAVVAHFRDFHSGLHKVDWEPSFQHHLVLGTSMYRGKRFIVDMDRANHGVELSDDDDDNDRVVFSSRTFLFFGWNSYDDEAEDFRKLTENERALKVGRSKTFQTWVEWIGIPPRLKNLHYGVWNPKIRRDDPYNAFEASQLNSSAKTWQKLCNSNIRRYKVVWIGISFWSSL